MNITHNSTLAAGSEAAHDRESPFPVKVVLPVAGESSFANKIIVLKIFARGLIEQTESLGDTLGASSGLISLSEEVRRFEAAMIRYALIETGGRQRRAARLLNMKVATLHAKIKRYKLDKEGIGSAL